MTHTEMCAHAQQHGNTGPAMQDAYEIVKAEDGIRWRVASA